MKHNYWQGYQWLVKTSRFQHNIYLWTYFQNQLRRWCNCECYCEATHHGIFKTAFGVYEFYWNILDILFYIFYEFYWNILDTLIEGNTRGMTYDHHVISLMSLHSLRLNELGWRFHIDYPISFSPKTLGWMK